MNKYTILVVDDTPDNISLISSLLKTMYKIKVATNGEKAIQVAREQKPDLILLDVMMPIMDGYDACKKMKSDPELKDIPVIFLTAKSKVEEEEMGLELGAVDYIIKPISPPILMARIKTHLLLKEARDFLIDKNQYLEEEVKRRVREIVTIQESSIIAMASLAETRDNETGRHIQRTQHYVRELAVYLSRLDKFKDVLTEETIDLLAKSAPLHDIGKVGIPDNILLKPDHLTQEEFDLMKTHTQLGVQAIARAEQVIENPETYLRFAKEIAAYHHEKWDGSGYPHGLKGEDIPLAARLMSVADVYDALVSRRVYKKAFPHQMAVDVIKASSGTQFDPDVVDAFLALEGRFLEICKLYQDR